MNILENLKNQLVVSVQSSKNDPTHNEICMNAFMQSAVMGGAKGLRLADLRDIAYAKKNFEGIAVIGLTKPDVIPKNFKELVYITPKIEDCKNLIEKGADIIAFDGTKRHNYLPLLEEIKSAKRLAMADISTFEEAVAAEKSGVDIISTTLSGYTTYSRESDEPDFELLRKCVKNLSCPTFLEGKIWEKNEVKKAFQLGAHSVVIGSAITRPWLITERFKNA